MHHVASFLGSELQSCSGATCLRFETRPFMESQEQLPDFGFTSLWWPWQRFCFVFLFERYLRYRGLFQSKPRGLQVSQEIERSEAALFLTYYFEGLRLGYDTRLGDCCGLAVRLPFLCFWASYIISVCVSITNCMASLRMESMKVRGLAKQQAHWTGDDLATCAGPSCLRNRNKTR